MRQPPPPLPSHYPPQQQSGHGNEPLAHNHYEVLTTTHGGRLPGSRSSLFGQCIASTQKHLVQKQRDWVACGLELLLPILFILGTVALWAAFGNQENASHQFVSYTNPNQLTTGGSNAYLRSNLCYEGSPVIDGLPLCSAAGFPSYALFPENSLVPVASLGYNSDTTQFIPRNAAGGLVFGVQSSVVAPWSLDDLVLLQWVARHALLSDRLRRNDYYSPLSAIGSSGFLYFAPDTTEVRSLVNHFNTTTNLFKYIYGGTFATAGAAEAYVKVAEHEGTNWGIVVVNQMTAGNFNVEIRLNHTAMPETKRVLDKYYRGGTTHSNSLYITNGFYTLQNFISKYYLEQVANTTTTTTVDAPYVSPMGYAAYEEQSFLAFGGELAPLIVVLGFLYPVSQLSKRLVLEKERRIREAMMIMGLSNFAFYFSWVVVYFFQHLLTSVVIMIILKLTYLPNANTGALFFCFFFFQLSTISLSGFISSFFSKSRIAALLTPLIYFILAMPLFAIETASSQLRGILLIISPTAFAQGIQLLFDGELGGGLGAANLNDDNPSMIGVLALLFIDTVLYMLLWLWVDAVMPNEWGTPRSLCFCVTEPIKKLCGYGWQNDHDTHPPDGRSSNGVFEDVPESSRTSVRFAGLRKQFHRNGETFTAVNNFYWSMEEGQISVLLGHNGAGKSTIMNMLTGMLAADGGDCYIYGHSVRHELQRVRQEIGYCPQHNVLWPELTCEEHLRFFASIKGLDGVEREEAISSMLRAVDLVDKRDYKSSDLSGGQKRKLCVAIAFVGGCRLIFLDEPTAGMDVGARRHTWELLQRMSADHTILLTTHFMDEADLLGHKIAIMSDGSLQCEGSSLFLKSRLGVGYTLVLSVVPNIHVQTFTQNVQNMVPQAELVSVGTGEICFRIPSASLAEMPPLLADLETNGQLWGVNNFTISATTLEEIFLKIAHGKAEAEKHHAQRPQLLPSAASQQETALPGPSTEDQADATATSIPPPSADCVWSVRRIPDDASSKIFASQMRCMLVKRLRNSLRDRRTQCLQIICPVVCILLAMLLTLIDLFSAPAIVLSSNVYGGPVEVNLYNCAATFDTAITFSSLAVTELPSTGISDALTFSQYLQHTADAHGNIPRYGAFACADVSMQTAIGASNPVSLAFYNSSSWHQLIISVFDYYNGVHRKTAGDGSFMHLVNNPMPKTEREDAFMDSIKSIMIGIIIMIPFTFIPSTFVSWIVKERECKARHLQNVSGLKFSVYWLSNFIFDMCSFCVTVGLTLIVFAIFNRTEYISASAIGPTIVLMLFYGLSGVGFSYTISFLFDEHSTAQNVVMLANFITGFLLVLVVFILGIVPSTEGIATVLSYIFRIIPSYCLGDGIINLALHQVKQSLNNSDSAWSLDIVGYDIIYMAIEFPLMLALTLFLDHPGRRMKTQLLLHDADKANPENLDGEDVDVKRERLATEAGGAGRDQDLVIVRNLRKEYPNGKVAVRNLSFGVHAGEVFGFLGTNGAGKTTTIAMLCQEFFPTSGHASIAGYDIVANAADALRCIGYCPQFDALLDLLTVEEHLTLYAGVRGIVMEDRSQVVINLAALCELTPYLTTLASQLSGGNKRKLSVALSLIGGPRVVFLDEPSAGMDPVARRGLWTAISNIAANCSVVLTTHHLEEVEALAHRVAIMVDGALHCIGTKMHLKQKYGSGFEMDIRLKGRPQPAMGQQQQVHPRDDLARQVATFVDFLHNELPAAKINEQRGNRFNVALPQDTQLSLVFHLLETHKAALYITDYSVSQTSIEQVFLRISMEAELSSASPSHNEAILSPAAL